MKFLFFSTLFICVISTKIAAQKTDQFDGYPTVKEALNEKIWVISKNYYLMAKASDSTVHLYWGNDSFKRKYYTDLDLPSAEKLHVKWTNKNYLILEYGTGSGAWIDIALPVNKNEKTQGFGNGIYFDKVDNLFVSEGYGDTLLTVRNLQTRRDQFIIDKRHCCSANNDVCIGLVEIKNKVLYTTWTPDNCTDDKKKTYEKKVKLKI